MDNKIILLRHSTCKSVELSDEDVPVTDEFNNLTLHGVEQAKQKAKDLFQVFKHRDVKIYSSTMLRAMQTSEIISKQLDCPIIFDKRLEEQYFLFSKSCNVKEFKELQLKSYKHPEAKFYDGESVYEHKKRLQSFFEEVLLVESSNIIIISHGGSVALLQQIILQQPLEAISNAFMSLDCCKYNIWTKFYSEEIGKVIWRLDGINI